MREGKVPNSKSLIANAKALLKKKKKKESRRKSASPEKPVPISNVGEDEKNAGGSEKKKRKRKQALKPSDDIVIDEQSVKETPSTPSSAKAKRVKHKTSDADVPNGCASDVELQSSPEAGSTKKSSKKEKRKRKLSSASAETGGPVDDVGEEALIGDSSGKMEKANSKSKRKSKKKKSLVTETDVMNQEGERDDSYAEKRRKSLKSEKRKKRAKIHEAGEGLTKTEGTNDDECKAAVEPPSLQGVEADVDDRNGDEVGATDITQPVGKDETKLTNESKQHPGNVEESGGDDTLGDGNDTWKSRKRRRSGDDEVVRPFKRVRETDVVFKHDELRDNSFFSKNDTYGQKAHNDLVVTKGKGFRKEKTKKKRLSHHGGKLNYQVNSFKFPDDDSD